MAEPLNAEQASALLKKEDFSSEDAREVLRTLAKRDATLFRTVYQLGLMYRTLSEVTQAVFTIIQGGNIPATTEGREALNRAQSAIDRLAEELKVDPFEDR